MADDGPCAFCGEPTNSLAGNPGKWNLMFTHPDRTGRARPHHVDCVQDRIFRYSAVLAAAYREGQRQMRERAAQVAAEYGKMLLASLAPVEDQRTRQAIVRSACDAMDAAIRALPDLDPKREG